MSVTTDAYHYANLPGFIFPPFSIFKLLQAAARAYDIASICVHGKDKRQNFPYADYVHYAQQFSQVSLGELSTILRSQVSAKTSRTSRYRGVRFNKTAGKWEATIHVGKNQIYLGLYEQESQAAQVNNNDFVQ